MEQILPQSSQKEPTLDFPGGPVVKTLAANAGDTGSIPIFLFLLRRILSVKEGPRAQVV